MGSIIKVAALNGILLSFDIPNNDLHYSYQIFDSDSHNNISAFNIINLFWENYFITNDTNGTQKVNRHILYYFDCMIRTLRDLGIHSILQLGYFNLQNSF